MESWINGCSNGAQSPFVLRVDRATRLQRGNSYRDESRDEGKAEKFLHRS
jgi:hypothetical protein